MKLSHLISALALVLTSSSFAQKRSPASIPGTTQLLQKVPQEGKGALEMRFKRALRLFESRDEEALVKLTTIEPDGNKKTQEIQIQRVGFRGQQRMLARVTNPPDLKGSAVLVIADKSAENQWIYLPSSKQTRKVVVSEQKGGILGTELRFEDINPSVIRRSNLQLLKSERLEGKNYDVIETLVPKGASPFDKAWVWIDRLSEMPIQIEYYAGGKKVKIIEFFDYYKVGNIWRPAKLAIKNLQTNRATDIEISDLKINKGIPSDRLSVESLSKRW